MPSRDQYSRLTDEQLIVLALAHDQLACGELVRRYRDAVFLETLLIVHDWDMADSATQHTFINAFDKLSTFKLNRKFGNWLLKIARNASLKRLKKQKDAPLRFDESSGMNTPDVEEGLQVPDRRPSPLRRVLSRERIAMIRGAMNQLRPEYKEALLLHAEQMPHKEIARKMGIPVNTVNSHIGRARHHLKELLGDQYPT